MQRPKIAILTPLVDFSSGYSLSGIILDQAHMFDRHSYEYDLLVLKNFNKNDLSRDGLPKRIRAILPQTKLHNYRWNEKPREDFEEQIDVHFGGRSETGEIGYKDALQPYDVVITHDLMFLNSHLCQNEAIRRCVELYPEKRWLHWIHSAPSGMPSEQPPYPSSRRFQGCENSTYVFLNSRQRQDVANHFQIRAADVAVVYNFKDPRDYYGFHEDVCELIERYDLLNHEILQVYPFSTPRWEAKGVSKLLRIWGFWRHVGINAKLVLVNAHANSESDEKIVRRMEDYARKCDLTPGNDVIWTSRFAGDQEVKNAEKGIVDEPVWDQWKYSVPARAVRELMQISNLFVFPSESECCSLIQAEAAISGKFVVLNKAFLPMLEFGSDNILSYDFQNNPNSNPAYYECLARELWGELQRDSTFMNSTRARTRLYNRDWVFKNQLEPLLNRVNP